MAIQTQRLHFPSPVQLWGTPILGVPLFHLLPAELQQLGGVLLAAQQGPPKPRSDPAMEALAVVPFLQEPCGQALHERLMRQLLVHCLFVF